MSFVVFLDATQELMFLETSALTGENVEEAFLKCARTILNKIESGKDGNLGLLGFFWGFGGFWGGLGGVLDGFWGSPVP